MNEHICLIYDKRPAICRDFPVCPANIKHLDKCTYKFDEKGIRSGECCGCGQCCAWGCMTWPVDLDVAAVALEITTDSLLAIKLSTDGKIIKDAGCRFLIDA